MIIINDSYALTDDEWAMVCEAVEDYAERVKSKQVLVTERDEAILTELADSQLLRNIAEDSP